MMIHDPFMRLTELCLWVNHLDAWRSVCNCLAFVQILLKYGLLELYRDLLEIPKIKIR